MSDEEKHKATDEHRKWVIKNREHIRAYNRDFRKKHPEYDKNPHRVALKKALREKNIVKMREYERFQAKKHIKRRLKYAKERRDKLRDNIHLALGGKCVRCGFDDYRALQIDHMRGRCASDKSLMAKSRCGYYKKVLDLINGGFLKYQLLCANCNWIKRAENKEYSTWKGKSPRWLAVERSEGGFADVKVLGVDAPIEQYFSQGG